MILVDNVEVFNFDGAIRGMRNPMNSWDKSDSIFDNKNLYEVGENDLDLMKRLYRAGTEHRKYLRQIMISMDITAPLYWWKEFDTYKVGTTANSCSTMHKIHAKKFTIDDFSHEHLLSQNSEYITSDFYNSTVFSPQSTLTTLIDCLNICRQNYLNTKDKQWWWQMIQLLPSSYNQKRTITMNYENAVTIIKQRTGHKLDEWNQFVEILKELPYMKEIIGNE